jgi:uncharacterized RDD family membrane protein YckC
MTIAMQDTVIYAGFWRRVSACILDMIFYLPLYAATYFLFAPNRILSDGLFMVIALITYAWLFSSPKQATPGMRLMNFYVCDTRGNRLSFVRALFWGISGTVGWLIALAGILYMMSNYDFDAIQAYLKNPDSNPVPAGWEDPENIQKYLRISFISLGVFFVFNLIWSLSIGLSKEKSGFHNVICRTRFVMGKR